MKSSIIFLVLLSTYCSCDRLLGGWSTSDDDSLKRECLNKALDHIHGARVNEDIRSQASDLNCKTQIVNGINIKCNFVLRGQKWQCSYYKSFIKTLETQLEQCKTVEEEPEPEQKKYEQANENLGAANEDEKVEQPLISNKDEDEDRPIPVNENEEEEKPAPVNENEQEEKSAPVDEDEEEEQPALTNEDEKPKQVVQESLISNENEEDDEDKIDVINKQMFEQNSNNEEEDDEAKIDAMNKELPEQNANNEEEQQQ